MKCVGLIMVWYGMVIRSICEGLGLAREERYLSWHFWHTSKQKNKREESWEWEGKGRELRTHLKRVWRRDIGVYSWQEEQDRPCQEAQNLTVQFSWTHLATPLVRNQRIRWHYHGKEPPKRIASLYIDILDTQFKIYRLFTSINFYEVIVSRLINPIFILC